MESILLRSVVGIVAYDCRRRTLRANPIQALINILASRSALAHVESNKMSIRININDDGSVNSVAQCIDVVVIKRMALGTAFCMLAAFTGILEHCCPVN